MSATPSAWPGVWSGVSAGIEVITGDVGGTGTFAHSGNVLLIYGDDGKAAAFGDDPKKPRIEVPK